MTDPSPPRRPRRRIRPELAQRGIIRRTTAADHPNVHRVSRQVLLCPTDRLVCPVCEQLVRRTHLTGAHVIVYCPDPCGTILFAVREAGSPRALVTVLDDDAARRQVVAYLDRPIDDTEVASS